MRKSAYITAISDAVTLLPKNIPELSRYFGDTYNPRSKAIKYIATKARLDGRIFDNELREILSFADEQLLEIMLE